MSVVPLHMVQVLDYLKHQIPTQTGGDGDSIMVSEQDNDDINNKPKKGLFD